MIVGAMQCAKIEMPAIAAEMRIFLTVHAENLRDPVEKEPTLFSR